jgi:hypothetical protein
LKVLTGFESTVISPIAFMLILITVVLFQPLYNLRELHQKIFSFLPSLFVNNAPVVSRIQEHDSESISQLKRFLANLFVIVCFAWVTVLLYEALPRFNFPVLYSRQVTAFILFLFFVSWPTVGALRALKKLLEHAVREQKRIVKRFAFKG